VTKKVARKKQDVRTSRFARDWLFVRHGMSRVAGKIGILAMICYTAGGLVASIDGRPPKRSNQAAVTGHFSRQASEPYL
jgi:hypothetical protein